MGDFSRIKEEYRKLHADFLSRNNLLVKYMNDNIWAPSIPKEVYKIFDRYKDKSKSFIDLGSGDGLVVMIASLFFGKAAGVEIEGEFYDVSLEMLKKLKIENVSLIHDDMFNIPLNDFDIVFMAPDKEFTLKLENKIERELNGILIVYSSIFQPKILKKIGSIETKYFSVGIYSNKAK